VIFPTANRRFSADRAECPLGEQAIELTVSGRRRIIAPVRGPARVRRRHARSFSRNKGFRILPGPTCKHSAWGRAISNTAHYNTRKEV